MSANYFTSLLAKGSSYCQSEVAKHYMQFKCTTMPNIRNASMRQVFYRFSISSSDQIQNCRTELVWHRVSRKECAPQQSKQARRRTSAANSQKALPSSVFTNRSRLESDRARVKSDSMDFVRFSFNSFSSISEDGLLFDMLLMT